MKACVLRQDEEDSQDPVCQLQFVSKLSKGNSTENPHVYFCKDILISMLHTITAQQPHVIIFIGEPQRDHGESWSQLWTQTHGMHSPAIPQNLPRHSGGSKSLSQGQSHCSAQPSILLPTTWGVQSLRFQILPLLPWLWSGTAESALKKPLTGHQTQIHIK